MLLDRYNTEFSDSVTRGSLHHKSSELKALLTALTTFQNQALRPNLIALNQALLHWYDKNPNEFSKRKGRVTDLRKEMGQNWLRVGNPFLTSAGSTEFEQSVTRGRLHYKSGALKRAIASLKRYQAGNAPAQSVYDQTVTWARKHRQEVRKRAWMADFLLAELRHLGAVAGPAAPVPVAAAGDVVTWTLARRVELDECKTTGCGDASRFGGMINADRRDQIVEREQATRTGRGDQAGGIGAVSKAWNPGALRNTYDGIRRDGGGVCTTFGHYCAHVLSYGRPLNQRIEVVAYKNHVFVIVGRRGGYREPGHGIPPRETWGNNYCIVDGWLGAMGYDVVYPNGGGYPYPGMLSPLTLVMASDIAEGDQAAVADLGLNQTVHGLW